MDKKLQALEKIAEEIKNCIFCQKNKVGLVVPGEGNHNALIVFIGEAPGKEEIKIGRPFIGRSGKLLRKMIKKIGLQEDDVFITSPVKYLPISGKPNTKEISHGMTHTKKQIAIIKPKLIVLLGSVACWAFLKKRILVLSSHGQIIRQGDCLYFITLHPAAVIRFPKYFTLFYKDFQRLKQTIAEKIKL